MPRAKKSSISTEPTADHTVGAVATVTASEPIPYPEEAASPQPAGAGRRRARSGPVTTRNVLDEHAPAVRELVLRAGGTTRARVVRTASGHVAVEMDGDTARRLKLIP